jgi:hypothetical protein
MDAKRSVRGAELFMQKYVSSACIYACSNTDKKVKWKKSLLYSDFWNRSGKWGTKEFFGSIIYKIRIRIQI